MMVRIRPELRPGSRFRSQDSAYPFTDYYFSSVTTAIQGLRVPFLTRILLTGKTMKPFLERLAARDELPSASSGPELST
jgi:hypothetical protein